MATRKNEVPPIPVPPPGASMIAPVEPPPAVPDAPAASYSQPAAPTVVPQPVAGHPHYGEPAYAPQPAAPSQGLSIASMILGLGGLLLSFVGWGFFPALAAVITGHLAQRRQPWAKPFWLTGIITGYVGVLISLVIGALALLFFLLAIGSMGYLR